MKFRLDKWQKDFNKNVYTGLAGGLLVYFALEGIREAIAQSLLPNTFLCRVFGVLILSILLFIIMALSSVVIKKLVG